MADLLSGRIGLTMVGPQGMLPYIRQGSLRALAVSTGTRYTALPDVPTLVECGFPSLDVPVWFAAFVRTATPAPILAKLRTTVAEVTGTPEYEAALAKIGALPIRLPAESADARLASEKKMWIEAVERTGAKGG
jgi:tripartite-type tricarboxylate transporter receptor subunit TctC